MAKTSALMMLGLPLTILLVALVLNTTGLLSMYIHEGFSDTPTSANPTTDPSSPNTQMAIKADGDYRSGSVFTPTFFGVVAGVFVAIVCAFFIWIKITSR